MITQDFLSLCLLGNFAFLSFTEFFFRNQFAKILSEIPFECQTVWIQIGHDILSFLIWVQTVCKSYQHTTLVGEELMPQTSSGQINLGRSLGWSEYLLGTSYANISFY